MPPPPQLYYAPYCPRKRGGDRRINRALLEKEQLCTRNALCDTDQARALCAIWNNPTIETAKQHEMTGHHAMKRIIINNKKIKH